MEKKIYIDAIDKKSSFMVKDFLYSNLKSQIIAKKI